MDPSHAVAGAPRRQRVLVTWGSKLGGTEGIARIIAEVLEHEGFDVVAQPASEVRELGRHDAAIIGGALYANRWHHDARRLVMRNVAALRRIPVWLFSSGPLDDSADRRTLPTPNQVAALIERIGARGHTTFGGRLPADARGFPAAAMAREHSGDWRNPERIRTWATDVAHVIPDARPGVAHEPPGRSLPRLLAHGVAAWALCAATMAGLLRLTSTGVAIAAHAVLAPLIFTILAVRYFQDRNARDPLPTALTWTALVLLLDAAIVAGLVQRDLAMFTSVTGTWLPLALGFLATWLTGFVFSTKPWPKPTPRSDTTTHARPTRLAH